MKRHLFLVVLSFLMCAKTFSQDIITTKIGDEIEAIVIKVSAMEIEYKKWTNQNGPIYTINKDDVFMIKYKNGEKDVFPIESNSNNMSHDRKDQEQAFRLGNIIDPQNSSMIEAINAVPVSLDLKTDRKTRAMDVAGFAGITEESILSNEDVTVLFCMDKKYIDSRHWDINYNICVKNKTDKILYIDKASCFYIDNDNNTYTFFNPNEVATTIGRSGGLSLSLGTVASLIGIGGTLGTIMGGLSANGGISSSSTTLERDQQIVSIPPHGTIVLVKGCKLPRFDYREVVGKIRMGQMVSFNYNDTPLKWTYFISYSSSKDFTNYGALSIHAYYKYIYGAIGCPGGGGSVLSNFKCNESQFYSIFSEYSYSTIRPNYISSRE